MSWIDICAIGDIPLRGARKLKTELGCVAVFRTAENEVFAASNTCPHKGGPLSEGIVHGQSVTCPLHNWVFDLNTGQAQGEDGQIDTFPLRVEAGRVLIDGTGLSGRSAA
ncbi:MAG: nitrite reductase small subunit NirD [Roseovarius sp.]|uniref:nitrite reductase small subunit NirD n=1 Tax=Roseovarius sp. TaxID=1486281 RepID=UPI0040593F65